MTRSQKIAAAATAVVVAGLLALAFPALSIVNDVVNPRSTSSTTSGDLPMTG